MTRKSKKESLKETKSCIETMKKIKTFRDHKIGVVVEDIPCLCGYKKGDIVLYRTDEKTITVEKAMNKKWIEENLKSKNLNTTHSTVVCVPKEYVIDLKNFVCETCLIC